MVQDLANRPHSGSFEGIRCCRAPSKGCSRQNDAGLGDESNDAHFAAAVFANQRVGFEHTADQVGPSSAKGSALGGVELVVVGCRSFFSGMFSCSSGVVALVQDGMLVGLGNRPHSGCFEGIRCCGAPPEGLLTAKTRVGRVAQLFYFFLIWADRGRSCYFFSFWSLRRETGQRTI